MSQEKPTLEQAADWVQEFCEARDWDQFHPPKDIAIGLVTEAAEFLELFRFQSEEQTAELLKHADFREKVSDELADVLFFLLRFSRRHKVDLLEALKNKLAKNNQKYPVELSRGSNVKYTDLKAKT